MTFRTSIGCAVIFLLLGTPLEAADYSGRVVGVIDGDTIEVLNGHHAERSGPIRLNSSPMFLSGFSADSHAASLPVGSITAYASSGVCLPRLECGLDWLYQPRYCLIEVLASVTES